MLIQISHQIKRPCVSDRPYQVFYFELLPDAVAVRADSINRNKKVFRDLLVGLSLSDEDGLKKWTQFI